MPASASLTRREQVLETIAASDKCNCGGILLDDDTKEVRVVSFNYARTERMWFDKELESDFKKLEAAAPKNAEVHLRTGCNSLGLARWCMCQEELRCRHTIVCRASLCAGDAGIAHA